MSRKSDIAKLERVACLNAMRNVIIHNYEGVSFRIVNRTLRDSLPELRAAIRFILSPEP